ncbi:hypothetical protein ABGB07_05685 [Micromonosporaceae bacterium B7E4]
MPAAVGAASTVIGAIAASAIGLGVAAVPATAIAITAAAAISGIVARQIKRINERSDEDQP